MTSIIWTFLETAGTRAGPRAGFRNNVELMDGGTAEEDKVRLSQGTGKGIRVCELREIARAKKCPRGIMAAGRPLRGKKMTGKEKRGREAKVG